MKLIKHRINTLHELKNLNANLGAEIDLRSKVSQAQSLHLSHDAWVLGDDFNLWIDLYVSKQKGVLILNTKEDGLEEQCLRILKAKNFDDFFFLDTTIPTTVRLGLNHKKHFCARLSTFESVDNCLSLKDYVDWVWVDCFFAKPVNTDLVRELKKHHFKICLVSPELQKGSIDDIQQFKDLVLLADAVCTKIPEAYGMVISNKK